MKGFFSRTLVRTVTMVAVLAFAIYGIYKYEFIHNQSPINIQSHSLKVEYGPEALKEKLTKGNLYAIFPSSTSKLILDGKTYTLEQLHFHTPSEHALNGQRFPGEAHFVHKSEDGGNLLVIGVFLKSDKPSALLGKMFENIPTEEDKVVTYDGTINPSSLIPGANRLFYVYKGSLTTPPYTHSVTWIVFSDPVSVSKEQLAKYRKMFGMNARSLQASYDRVVSSSEDVTVSAPSTATK